MDIIRVDPDMNYPNSPFANFTDPFSLKIWTINSK
jgi:hypothetical protein